MNKKKRAGDRENNFFFLFFSGNIRLGKFDNCLLGGGGSGGGGGGGGRQVLAARIKAEQCEGGGGEFDCSRKIIFLYLVPNLGFIRDSARISRIITLIVPQRVKTSFRENFSLAHADSAAPSVAPGMHRDNYRSHF